MPKIIDVTLQMEIMRELGAQIRQINATTVEIQNTQNPSLAARAGAQAARILSSARRAARRSNGFAEVAMPGGCNSGGVRPIDQHIKRASLKPGRKGNAACWRLHPGRGT